MEQSRHERFRALYLSTRPQILSYALRRSPSLDDASDVVAETFAIAWRRLDDLPDGPDALLWLYVTARHVLANEARRAQRSSDLVARIASALAGHEPLVRPKDESALAALLTLRELDEEDRELLMLAGWEGLDANELGRVLGCSPGAARIRLHRARTRLEERIARFSDGGSSLKQASAARHKEDEGAAIGCAHEEA